MITAGKLGKNSNIKLLEISINKNGMPRDFCWKCDKMQDMKEIKDGDWVIHICQKCGTIRREIQEF